MELVDIIIQPSVYNIRNSISANFTSNYVLYHIENKLNKTGMHHGFILNRDIFYHQFNDLKDRFKTGEIHSYAS